MSGEQMLVQKTVISELLQAYRREKILNFELELECSITLTQLLILDHLATSKDSCMKNLAELLGVTPAVITGMVDRLEKRMFVTRVRSSGNTDRRVTRPKITPQGKAVFEKATLIINQISSKKLI